jgi:hypothetical protein
MIPILEVWKLRHTVLRAQAQHIWKERRQGI